MKYRVITSMIAGLLLLANPAFSHHSQVMYEDKKEVTLQGVVTKLQWTNPHVWIWFDIKDKDGKVTNWGIEANSVPSMTRVGWTRNEVKAGDKVTIVTWPMKDGSTKGLLRKMTTEDGKTRELQGNGPQAPRQ